VLPRPAAALALVPRLLPPQVCTCTGALTMQCPAALGLHDTLFPAVWGWMKGFRLLSSADHRRGSLTSFFLIPRPLSPPWNQRMLPVATFPHAPPPPSLRLTFSLLSSSGFGAAAAPAASGFGGFGAAPAAAAAPAFGGETEA
jgi:hypothetical protein